ncbi:MAG: winged helix-turn-helix domain-containing protein [Gammaproteobacteria bacterium]|nr:winged helix-turn-helix domain-containing protein [Rhodospirillaceae bacterium]MBT7878306.1 winged helix-turn-helix domain-containing protein [Gammaproteobacteria bacterium]MBT3887137.1 winged helix-turn-helix domain-containing protein [Rhodospirillaceae bacterium]MBT4673237.1 winged helix-turn-helix domain-containing protein [Rhodospirillaceae bacterium]MBT4718760.1 winged helix-turn-helix domain-containing protein [Rhodospirillaceae bacterium]
MQDVKAQRSPTANRWTFMSNHAHVILCVAENPRSRTRDLAMTIGITERAVQRIIAELEADGYLSHRREGRNNHYTVHTDLPLRHPVEQHCGVSALIEMSLTGSRANPAY